MALRRASDVTMERRGFGIFARHEVRAGARVLARLDRRSLEAARRSLEAHGAAAIADEGGRTLWWTEGGYAWDDEGLDAEAVGLLLWDRRRRQDARIERLRRVRAAEEVVEAARRQRIPDEVRLFVWHRDDGRCVRCGAEEELQFDHVIPVAKGGGNAAENVQILCGDCNRRKSDAIA